MYYFACAIQYLDDDLSSRGFVWLILETWDSLMNQMSSVLVLDPDRCSAFQYVVIKALELK